MNPKDIIFPQKLILILFTFITFLASYPTTGLSETMSVQGDKVNLRANPDQKAKTLWEYGNGFPLEVIKKQGDWVLVKDFENDSGWIHKSRLQKNKQVIVKANKEQDKTINIRSGPSTDSAISANAYYGVVFTALEKRGPWLQVRHDSGLTGWVKLDFVWGF